MKIVCIVCRSFRLYILYFEIFIPTPNTMKPKNIGILFRATILRIGNIFPKTLGFRNRIETLESEIRSKLDPNSAKTIQNRINCSLLLAQPV